MATFLVVLRRSGPHWDPSRPLEEQSGWSVHASFMDGLVDAGFILLGGPLADDDRVVHAVEAESDDAVRATLARDPWSETHLEVDTIDPDDPARQAAPDGVCPNAHVGVSRRVWMVLIRNQLRRFRSS